MTSMAHWVAGARPRTLPAAVSPVIAGAATAIPLGELRPLVLLGAFIVALSLQVGVNYANDYSDGVRGTDSDRVGPMRLVGSGAASPAAVKRAAVISLAVAGIAGIGVVIGSGHYWLLLIGLASILAAWYYTGGKRPYGYAGWGEVMVFIFFGLVAVTATTYVMVDRISIATVLAAVVMGLLASAILVANNLRDAPKDKLAGKHTLATRIGEDHTRRLFVVMLIISVACLLIIAAITTWWALLSLVMMLPAGKAARIVLGNATGADLIPVLQTTGIAELLASVGLLLGMVLGFRPW